MTDERSQGSGRSEGESFQALAAETDRMVFVWATDGRMLWTNEVFVRETGLTPSDFGFDNRENPFIHPDDLPRVLGELGAFVGSAARKSPVIRNRFVDAWGQTREIATVVHKVDWQGEPALMLISRLIGAEADASYRRLVDFATDVILKLARDGRIIYSNRQFQGLVGLSIVEISKRRLQDFAAAADRPRIEEALRRLALGEARVSFDLTVPIAGALLHFAASAGPLPPGDEASPYLAILRDLTELRSEQARREAALVALEDARRLEAMGRLAGGLAHDFNSVLAVVKAWASLLESGDSPEDRLAAVASLRFASDRAAALTRQLLSFARRDALRVTPVDVDEAMRATVPSLGRLLPPEIRIELTTGARGKQVLLDDTQLNRILLNLATNARDAMKGAGVLTISSRPTDRPPADAKLGAANPARPAGYVEISVRDSGGGMEPAALAHLFEPFFTTKPQGRGTGLGLASIYGIVSELGGYIALTSVPGQGTTFRIGLPVAAPASAGPREAPRPRPASTAPSRILVVDDDAITREVMTAILERGGFAVLAAADGDEAMGLLAPDGPGIDLLCTDGMLPGVPPHELIERVRARCPDARVLVVSGLVADEPALQELRAGALPFLAKPFDADELVDKVNEVLSGR
jgi:PAS domain S-box-containing protein